MITLEMVEKLREKANVTYDEAKAALEAADGNLLDAIVLLERQGKVVPPLQGGEYSSQSNSQAEADGTQGHHRHHRHHHEHGKNFSYHCKRFLQGCGHILEKGNRNFFDAVKDEKVMITLPVTALVLLLIFAFWIVLPLIIIGLFCGYRFEFRGSELGRDDVNRVMDKAAQTAENIKSEIKQGMDKHE